MQLPRTALQVQRAEECKSSSRKLAQLGKQPLGVTDLLAEEDQSLFSAALEEDEADDEDSRHGEDGGEDDDTADELSPAGVVHLVQRCAVLCKEACRASSFWTLQVYRLTSY